MVDEKKKRPILLYIIIAVVLLLAAGAGAFFFLYSAPSDEELAESISGEIDLQKKEKAPVGIMIPLNSFVVNLSDPRARRFLKAIITLEVVDKETVDEVDTKLPKIRNDIIMLLSNQTLEDVITMEGKVRLRDEITIRVGRIIGEKRLKNVYFTQFVVQ